MTLDRALDQALLDDDEAIAAGDPQQMLRAVASSGAQVREATTLAQEAGIDRVGSDGRPRAIVVAGMGGSGVAGDVLSGVAGLASPVPISSHKSYGLPGWVGPLDLVIAVSCSGSTEETLSAAEEAGRRGARLLAVGATGSPLEDLAAKASGVFIPVTQGRQPRASLWSLVTPVVMAGHALGLLDASSDVLEATASTLDSVAHSCRPDAVTFTNPAKSLAVELDGTSPVVWGTSPLTGAAAYRFTCQCNENAKTQLVWGVLPEANHNQVVAFDGRGGAMLAAIPAEDTDPEDLDLFFRDRAEDPEPRVSMPLRLVLLRDLEEHPQVTRRADVSAELALSRGIEVSELRVSGDSPLERLASIVGLTDFASVFLALLYGVDPTPVDAIGALKARIARSR
jgi:glucose/mannose-6-phosphate isomerase